MKRLITTLTICLFIGSAFAQKLHERKSAYYAEKAAKEFSLSKDDQQKVYDNFLNLRLELSDLNGQVKEGKLTNEEMKPLAKEVNLKYKNFMAELTGKPKRDLEPFFKQMREELKDVK